MGVIFTFLSKKILRYKLIGLCQRNEYLQEMKTKMSRTPRHSHVDSHLHEYRHFEHLQSEDLLALHQHHQDNYQCIRAWTHSSRLKLEKEQ